MQFGPLRGLEEAVRGGKRVGEYGEAEETVVLRGTGRVPSGQPGGPRWWRGSIPLGSRSSPSPRSRSHTPGARGKRKEVLPFREPNCPEQAPSPVGLEEASGIPNGTRGVGSRGR